MISSLSSRKHNIFSHLILANVVLTTVTSIYVSRHGLSKALVFPSAIDAVIGEEIYLKLTKPVADQTGCYYRQSGGEDFDVTKPSKLK